MFSRINHFARCNGYLLALTNVPVTLGRKAYSAYLSRVLRATNAQVEAFAFVRGVRNIKVGKNFRSRKGLWLEAVTDYESLKHDPRISIGDDVTLSRDVHIAAILRVTIGSGVLMGSRIMISDHSHGYYNGPHSDPAQNPAYRALVSKGEVVIEDNVWLGDGVVVLPGVTIGFGSVIGANSVVSRDVAPMTIAGGNPVVAIKRYQPETGRWERIPVAAPSAARFQQVPGPDVGRGVHSPSKEEER